MTEFDQQLDFISANFISSSHLPEVLPFLKDTVHYISLPSMVQSQPDECPMTHQDHQSATTLSRLNLQWFSSVS